MAVEVERYPEIYQNRRDMLRRRVPQLADMHESGDGERMESLCSVLSNTYYAVGLLAFVLDADRQAFFENLFRAAKTHQYLIVQQKSIEEIDWSFVNASEIRSTLYALAIGEIGLAREISTAQTKEFVRPFDAGDFYLFAIALRQLVEGDTGETAQTLDKFDQAREGRRAGAAEVLRGLLAKDAKRLDAGIRTFIDEWRTIVEEDSFEDFPGGVLPGEESVCTQALAFIRLAEARGIPTQPNYPLVPPELRRFDGVVPPTDGFPVIWA
jgi:hypothetical protein